MTIESLLENGKARQDMSQNGLKIFDDRGAELIITNLMGLHHAK